MNFNNIYTEFYVVIILLALLFYGISKVKTNHLIAIIIILMVSAVAYLHLKQLSDKKDSDFAYVENTLNNDIKERKETNEEIFYIDKFPKHLNYLKKNKKLIDIVTNLRFTRKFNKTRYSDMLINMNKLMKIYIYILADRYDAVEYIPLFLDIRDNISELMSSLFIIIPAGLKHTYGLDPHEEIRISQDEFRIYADEMLSIIEKYAIIYKKEVYIPSLALKV